MHGLDADQALARLERLVSPFGPVAAVRSATPSADAPRLTMATAYIGGGGTGAPSAAEPAIAAYGSSLESEQQARIAAIAEGAERYAGRGFADDGSVWATAADLDGRVIDPATVPRCSVREYSTPGCPLRPADPHTPIRWLRGVDLATVEPVWLPAVMAHYGSRDVTAAERFWYRISTGHAVHFDPAEALVRGICEVVEREAIATTWLQQMPLPPVGDSKVSVGARQLIDWAHRHFIDTWLFDATTDLGVPTVLCLQVARYDDRARHIFGCAAGTSMAACTEKAIRDALLARDHCYTDRPVPTSRYELSAMDDGLRFMATAERGEAFDFLLRDIAERTPVVREDLPADSVAALGWLISRMESAGIGMTAVELTTPELAAIGLTATNVVIPDLVPMTLHPLAQFRNHPRLYEIPRRMGFTSHPEQELNPWPLPFA